MKTLILVGSPRKNGNTMALVNRLTGLLNGEKDIISAYHANISACIDCRYCWKKPGCSIADDMQKIYQDMDSYDAVVIASPLNFSELTGKLLCVASRLQTCWTGRHFRGEKSGEKRKSGVLIIVGGGFGHPKKAISTAKVIFDHMDADCDYIVQSLKTDEIPAIKDKNSIEQLELCAKHLNEKYRQDSSQQNVNI